jgi:hypothetical protein
MTIKVNNWQLSLLKEAVRDKMRQARSLAFVRNGPPWNPEYPWRELHTLLRSIEKHRARMRPKTHDARLLRRHRKRFAKLTQS